MRAVLETLRRGDEPVRRALVEELGRSGLAEAIPPLLVAVGDEGWPVRQAASERLAGFDRTLLLPALEAALRNQEDAATRNAAMEIYVRLGAQALPHLVALLADGDEEIRNFAAVMLGTLGDVGAVPSLIAALGDADVNVRHGAATSLGQIGSPEAVVPLIEVLRTEPWLQYPAINALGALGDARATPALLDMLDEELLRAPAIEAIGRIAGRDALARLIPHLHDPDPAVRNAAIHAVVSIEQRATAAGDSLDPDLQEALRREDLVDHLLGTLGDDEPQNRRTAAITLGWLKEPRAERPLIELLAEPDLQEYVTHALVSIGGQAEAYAQGLTHAVDAVRQGSLRCLAWIAPPWGNEPGRAADPRPRARGAGRGCGEHRAARARGRRHAALRAAGRRERDDPGERHERPLAHAPGARGPPAAAGPG